MQAEYERHLAQDYGEAFVKECWVRRYRVDKVKNWEEVIHIFDSL